MIHDARVEVTCDGARCIESVDVELEVRFRSYGDERGHYDDSNVAEVLRRKGWSCDDECERTLCPDCVDD